MISHGSSLAPCARGDGYAVAAQDCGGTVACTKPRRGTLAKCQYLCPAGVPPTRASPEALPRRTAAVPPLGGYRSEVGARRMTSKAEESPTTANLTPARPGADQAGLDSAATAACICSGTFRILADFRGRHVESIDPIAQARSPRGRARVLRIRTDGSGNRASLR